MNLLDIIHERTRGRPYILVVMAYTDRRGGRDKRRRVFEMISEVAEQRFNYACLRADEILTSGHELLSKIHLLIDRAALVITEISDPRPNVFYELGYAMGAKKVPLLLIESKLKAPYDLQGLEVFEYENTFEGVDMFRTKLAEHLHFRLRPQLGFLRALLGAPKPDPSFIVSSPKYPGKHSRIQGQVFDSRTFGDHLGILGLISTFGVLYGESCGIDLISAQHATDDLLERDLNLYLIGSRKVNRYTKEVLDFIQGDQELKWVFDPHPDWEKGDEGDWPVCLYRDDHSMRTLVKGKAEQLGAQREWVWTSDHGVIVRSAHPHHPGRLVLVLAGPHSLGTGAACLAATRISLIEKIAARLPHGVLEDKERAFWVLVKGTVSREDYLLDEEGVVIVDAGVYS